MEPPDCGGGCQMVFKDYYKILDLETSRVSIDEIKNAYRNAAKKYHPDVNIGDSLAEERIKDINEAYRILSVPSSKRKYDRIWNSRNLVNKKFDLKGKDSIVKMFFGNVKQENNLPILLVNEELETYKNIISYLKSEKTELVKDLFVSMNGVFVNFLSIKEDDINP